MVWPGAGILASRLIIQNHVMSLYNFMHWLTMMMMMLMTMTMTTAMIMTTPTQADGDRAQTVGQHRQTYSGTAGQTHTEQRDISEKATTAHAVRVGNRVVGRGGMGGRSHHMWQSRNVVPLPTLTHTHILHTLWQSESVAYQTV